MPSYLGVEVEGVDADGEVHARSFEEHLRGLVVERLLEIWPQVQGDKYLRNLEQVADRHHQIPGVSFRVAVDPAISMHARMACARQQNNEKKRYQQPVYRTRTRRRTRMRSVARVGEKRGCGCGRGVSRSQWVVVAFGR